MTKRKPNRDGSRIYGDTPSRFAAKVNQAGPECPTLGSTCWSWLPPLRSDGYGQFWMSSLGRAVVAHRYSYELHVGPIPPGSTLDHLCRNRGCVNPARTNPSLAERTYVAECTQTWSLTAAISHVKPPQFPPTEESP